MIADGPRVAIVHDYLTQRGGAERVVLAMARAFPDAPVHTSLYDPDGTYPEFAALDVRTAPLDRIGPLRERHRLALPLLAPTFSAMHVDADVVVCSSSGWAHGVSTHGRKLVYCHAPARWLYQSDAYLAGAGAVSRAGFATMRPLLTRWDQRSARTATRYLANSRHTQRMVLDAYGIDAEVLHPPCVIDADDDREPVGLVAGMFLCVSRLLAYKHVDAVVEAFRALPELTLVVVGTGPEASALRELAPANVHFLPSVTDAQLRWLYANARALIAASFEDFGLTPIEAASFGTPTIALRYGGYLDTVVEGRTGVFFETPTPSAITAAVQALLSTETDADAIRRHAGEFDEAMFSERLRDVVDALASR